MQLCVVTSLQKVVRPFAVRPGPSKLLRANAFLTDLRNGLSEQTGSESRKLRVIGGHDRLHGSLGGQTRPEQIVMRIVICAGPVQDGGGILNRARPWARVASAKKKMESARQKDPHFILSLAGRGEELRARLCKGLLSGSRENGELCAEMISLG
jgi:hypothetical protein